MYDEVREEVFRANWEAFLWRQGRVDRGGRVTRVLLNNYGGQNRHYHTFWHINGCLELLAEARRDMPEWFTDKDEDAATEFSLIEHDVIDEAGARDNEERSVALAGIHARYLGFAARVTSLLTPNILATKHGLGHATLRSAQIVADIDLSTVAAPWEEFLHQGRLLRMEAVHVESDEEVARMQRVFLLGLIDLSRRPSIFQTGYFKERFEANAYANITRFAASAP